MPAHDAVARATAFSESFNLRAPILMAPMAGACPAPLAIAVANAGGLGGYGVLLMQPNAIREWAAAVRAVRAAAVKENDIRRMQAWAGQSAA